MQYILSRLCCVPNCLPDKHCHSALYPISERSHSTLSNPRIIRAGLFSMMMYLGLTSPIILNISPHKPLLCPLIPSFVPLFEMSWQGNPPLIMSTYLGFRNSLMSAYCSVFGKCCFNIFFWYGNISQFHNVLIFDHSAPNSNPPIPLNKE